MTKVSNRQQGTLEGRIKGTDLLPCSCSIRESCLQCRQAACLKHWLPWHCSTGFHDSILEWISSDFPLRQYSDFLCVYLQYKLSWNRCLRVNIEIQIATESSYILCKKSVSLSSVLGVLWNQAFYRRQKRHLILDIGIEVFASGEVLYSCYSDTILQIRGTFTVMGKDKYFIKVSHRICNYCKRPFEFLNHFPKFRHL